MKKRALVIFILLNPFQFYLSMIAWGASVFYLLILFLLLFFVFQGKNLVLLNLINRYVSNIWKAKTLGNSVKYIFDITELFTQCNRVSYCEDIKSGVYIYLYGCVSLQVPVYILCLCMCVISNQSTSKKTYYLSDLSKLDSLMHKTHSKVLLVLWYYGI